MIYDSIYNYIYINMSGVFEEIPLDPISETIIMHGDGDDDTQSLPGPTSTPLIPRVNKRIRAMTASRTEWASQHLF